MKICHLSNSLPTYHNSWGGAEQACLRIANLLSKESENDENFVFSLPPEREVKENFKFFPVPVIENFLPKFLAKPISSLKSYFFPFDPLAFRFFNKFFKENKIDVLHLHKFSILSFSAISAAKKYNIPVIHSLYDYWIFCPLGFCWKVKNFYTYEGEPCNTYHGSKCLECIEKARRLNFLDKLFLKIILPFRRKMFAKYIQAIDIFIALSEKNKRIPLNYGIPEEKIAIVPLVLPLNQKPPVDINKVDRNTIVFIGPLHPKKGVSIAIDSFKYVVEKFSKVKLYMIGPVGDKEYEGLIKKQIARNGLEKNIILLGRISEKDKEEYLKKAFILLVPEPYEVIASCVLIEGMAAGKGIVTGNIGGSTDYIRDNENGFLAEYNNPKSFALQIIKFLENPELVKSMGQQAKLDVEKSNSEERVRTLLINLYKSLCQK